MSKSPQTWGWSNGQSLTNRRLWILRAGFTALLVLLSVSILFAFEIQRGLSKEVAQTYHTYLQQEESLYNIRRTVWQSSVLVRDLLLDTSPDRERKFAAAMEIRRKEALEAAAALTRNPIPGQDMVRLNSRIAEFWVAVAGVPETTRTMNQAQRFDFVQNDVAVRRLALSDLVREVSALGRGSLTAAEATLDANRRAAGARLVGVIALALLAGLVFARLSLRRLDTLEAQTAEQYDEVLRTKAELQALSAQLMSIQENERARLSRELHDEIGQALATLRLELASLETAVRENLPDIHTRLSRPRAIVESTVKAVRDISLMLRPSLLDDLGLVSALQWMAEDSTRRTGIRCQVREENVSDELPVDIRTCVYRVAQEALHNAEKHSGAASVLITVEQRGTQLALTVDDDGRGLDRGDIERWKTGAHLGILGMRERVTALAGRFQIGPAPSGGTRVCISLPLPVDSRREPAVEPARESFV